VGITAAPIMKFIFDNTDVSHQVCFLVRRTQKAQGESNAPLMSIKAHPTVRRTLSKSKQGGKCYISTGSAVFCLVIVLRPDPSTLPLCVSPSFVPLHPPQCSEPGFRLTQ